MAKHAVKCTIWLQLEMDADGLGDAQWEIRQRIQDMAIGSVEIAHAVDMEFFDPKLREEMTECDWALYFGDVTLDDGFR